MAMMMGGRCIKVFFIFMRKNKEKTIDDEDKEITPNTHHHLPLYHENSLDVEGGEEEALELRLLTMSLLQP